MSIVLAVMCVVIFMGVGALPCTPMPISPLTWGTYFGKEAKAAITNLGLARGRGFKLLSIPVKWDYLDGGVPRAPSIGR